jgi:preprotein translocase subunit SecE
MSKQSPDKGKEAKKNSKELAAKGDKQKPVKATSKSAKTDKDQKRPVAKSGKLTPKKEGIFKKIANYFRNVRLEIKRTTWPTRPEVGRMSLIVMGALLFFGVFIFVIDWGMTELIKLYSSLDPTPAVDPNALPLDGTDLTGTDTTGTDTTGTDAAATDGSTDGATDPATTDTTGSETEGTDTTTGEGTE